MIGILFAGDGGFSDEWLLMWVNKSIVRYEVTSEEPP
jgi:hypothetical protein